MSDIQYETENIQGPQATYAHRKSLSEYLIARGIVSNEKQAQKVLLGTLVIAIVLIVWLLWQSNSSPKPVQTHQEAAHAAVVTGL